MRMRPLVLLGLLSLGMASTGFGQEVQGLVQPVKQVSVSSPVLQEVVEAVLVEEGHVVKEGQVLVELRKIREELAVQEGQRLVENAQYVASGTEALARDKMGSREQALRAKTELELAKLKLANAQEALREKTIRSPLAGIVVKKYKEVGESVDRVEKLVDIVNIDRVYVQFYLDPKLMPELKVGQTISVRFPVLKEGNFQGKIDFVDPRIDASSSLFRVKVLLENPEQKIKAGMRGLADFTKRS